MLNLDACKLLLSRLPIKHWRTKQPVPFDLNYNQNILLEAVKLHQAKLGGRIRVISVKARKVGFSAIVDGLAICHIAAKANANAWIVSCLDNSSEELFKVPVDLVNNWPFPLPKPLSNKITYPHKIGDSYLTFHTAKSVMSGRGPSLSFLHLSECAYYSGGGSLMSLFPAINDNDTDGAIWVESTAQGQTGQGETFYKMWEAAVRGDNEYLPIFLTWLDDIECKREPDGLDLCQMHNEDELNIIQLAACSDKCGRCANCRKALECIAWRRWAIPNKCQGRVELFRQEYPVTAEEAFYSTSYPAFTPEEIRKVTSTIREPIAIGRLEVDTDSYGVSGTDKPRFVNDDRGLLRIWAWPNPGYHYYIGNDAARGSGGDYASSVGWCGQTGEQVFRFASKHLDPESFAKILFLLGTFYNHGMVNIELTGNLGLWAQKVLRDTHKYRNLYRWKGRDDRTPGPRNIGSIGWETTMRTRPMMLASLRGGIIHDRLKVRDAELLRQMKSMEMVDDRWQVPEDIHDDIFVASAIGWIARDQWHTGFVGAEVKQLLGDEVAQPQDSDKSEVKNAKGDVQAAVQAHWKKMLRTVLVAGRGLQLVEKGEGDRPADRLLGI